MTLEPDIEPPPPEMTLVVNPKPTRETMVRWLRLNLALTLTLAGVVASIVTGITVGTWRVAKFDERLQVIENWQGYARERVDKIGPIDSAGVTLAERVAALEVAQLAAERRISDRLSVLDIDRRERDTQWLRLHDDLSTINGRIDVFNSQIGFFGRFIDQTIHPPITPTITPVKR